MNRAAPALVLGLALVSGCATRRVLAMENRLLSQENAELRKENEDLRKRAPPPQDFVPEPTIEHVSAFLDRLGYDHEVLAADDAIHLDHAGKTHTFTVEILRFPDAGILFMGVQDWISLDEVRDVDDVTLLLVQIATLNYELLVGKLQIDPTDGDVLLSVELPIDDGLGFETFRSRFEGLLETASDRRDELADILTGGGL